MMMKKKKNITRNQEVQHSMSLGDWIELSIHTSMHCVFMVTFLTCFYFFYVFPVEGESLSSTVSDLVRNEFEQVLDANIKVNYTLPPGQTYNTKLLDPIYEKELQSLVNIYLTQSIKSIEPKKKAAQEKIKKERNHAIFLSFVTIGVTAVILIVVHLIIIYSNPKIPIFMNKINYSVMYSISFVIIIEISFFLLITKNLKPVSNEELEYLILIALQKTLHEKGLSIRITME